MKIQFSTENINIANLKINNIDVMQYLITNDAHVTFKLFISSKYSYQVDYIIPLEIYKEELRKIESSIGTIAIKGERE